MFRYESLATAPLIKIALRSLYEHEATWTSHKFQKGKVQGYKVQSDWFSHFGKQQVDKAWI